MAALTPTTLDGLQSRSCWLDWKATRTKRSEGEDGAIRIPSNIPTFDSASSGSPRIKGNSGCVSSSRSPLRLLAHPCDHNRLNCLDAEDKSDGFDFWRPYPGRRTVWRHSGTSWRSRG